jgi:hypothetical protein
VVVEVVGYCDGRSLKVVVAGVEVLVMVLALAAAAMAVVNVTQ